MLSKDKVLIGKALDSKSLLQGVTAPKVPKNDHGAVVSADTWALAGLHLLRVKNPTQFTPAEVTISTGWLKMNGYSV